jgi:hypothetical protein
MSDAIPRDVPFSLSCTECDGDSPDNYEDAIRDGWTEIQYSPEGSSENFLGLCPDCRQKEERMQAQLRKSFTADEQEGENGCPT